MCCLRNSKILSDVLQVPFIPRLREINASSLPMLGSCSIDSKSHPEDIIELRPIAPKETKASSLVSSGGPSTTGMLQFRKKQEKSTGILVSIVVLFLICHSYRLFLKIYEFASPSSHVMDSFTYCFNQKR